ncbi:DNRLRE domain-containing protein [Parapedobacter sp. SGR-10]|uniref:CBM96 family carbohydrate-binding protein n=1 Tax=Parapedobacter sp. SGR-10 TaxID=2710879 RepID=UPI0013D349BD|nr:fasciclin domain-containing protein [Parapedobacter sp. SGR-10]NGF55839.1 DNRLRE domain-containing protein [Parapedobacter sp. SGR-10]
MKRIHPYKLVVHLILAAVLTGSCGKLELLKNVDSEAISAGEDLKNQTIWEFISSTSSIANDTLKSLSLFTRAVERAGLKEFFGQDGQYTIIAPRNTAMEAFIASLGYSDLEDVPPAVLRNIFLGNTVNGKIFSYELPEGELMTFETMNKDSISFIREPASTNPYRVTINSAPTFVSTAVRIRSQNLLCKNGVVHVIDTYTHYIPRTSAPDAASPGEGSMSETLDVLKDAYMSNGSTTAKNTNYGSAVSLNVKKAAVDFTRRAITQFEVRQPHSFQRIGTARVGLYCTRVDGDGGIVSLFEDEPIDWLENQVSWANCPIPGTVPIGDVNLSPGTGASGSVNKWHYIDITNAYQDAVRQNKTFINVGINTADNDLFTFASKEYSTSSIPVGTRAPIIILTSPVASILSNPVNAGITVDRQSGNKILTTSELKFEGAESKNIFFVVKDLPQMGYLVVGGRPVLQEGVRFSQEQIEKGAVRYLHSGEGNIDSFSLEGQDFQGGFYDDVLTVNVTIQ